MSFTRIRMLFDFPRESLEAYGNGQHLEILKENYFQPRISYLDKCENKTKICSKIKVSKIYFSHMHSQETPGAHAPTNKIGNRETRGIQ